MEKTIIFYALWKMLAYFDNGFAKLNVLQQIIPC